MNNFTLVAICAKGSARYGRWRYTPEDPDRYVVAYDGDGELTGINPGQELEFPIWPPDEGNPDEQRPERTSGR